MFATRFATRPGQLPVYAMKGIVALPGLEPDCSALPTATTKTSPSRARVSS
jgi:hypothetical protein